jgi:hypothetical protein
MKIFIPAAPAKIRNIKLLPETRQFFFVKELLSATYSYCEEHTTDVPYLIMDHVCWDSFFDFLPNLSATDEDEFLERFAKTSLTYYHDAITLVRWLEDCNNDLLFREEHLDQDTALAVLSLTNEKVLEINTFLMSRLGTIILDYILGYSYTIPENTLSLQARLSNNDVDAFTTGMLAFHFTKGFSSEELDEFEKNSGYEVYNYENDEYKIGFEAAQLMHYYGKHL